MKIPEINMDDIINEPEMTEYIKMIRQMSKELEKEYTALNVYKALYETVTYCLFDVFVEIYKNNLLEYAKADELDKHGEDYGIKRNNEDDENYRERIKKIRDYMENDDEDYIKLLIETIETQGYKVKNLDKCFDKQFNTTRGSVKYTTIFNDSGNNNITNKTNRLLRASSFKFKNYTLNFYLDNTTNKEENLTLQNSIEGIRKAYHKINIY